MPIKSCKQCGLKVLVDASQAASDDYVCPRCAPAAAAPAPKASGGGGRRASVKVTCPYCGAAFSGSVPSRPAKGGCPVCQKELVLLPDGTIQAAASFNLAAWQKGREPRKPEVRPAPAEEARGGSTILDAGGPPAPSSADDLDMAIPGGLGGETMLGMGGHGAPSAPEPPPAIDEPASPPPAPEAKEDPEPALPMGGDDLGGETILDMGGPPAGEGPPPTIEEKPEEKDLLSEVMPGMDRPPSEESPVEPPPPPPPLPEPKEEVEPALSSHEDDPSPPEEERSTIKEEQSPATMTSLPGDLGGTTMLGIGGSTDVEPPRPEPIPTIEDPPPEAVPILAKDLGDDPSPTPPPQPIMPEEPAAPKPYVYGPISRKPRVPVPPPPPPAAAPAGPMASSALPPPPPPASNAPPVLGNDFRISAAPPAPKPPSLDRSGEGSRPTTTGGLTSHQMGIPRPRTSLVRMMVAWLLLLLPVAIGMMAHTLRKDERVDKVLKTISNEALKGFKYVDGEIRKAIAKPAEAPPAPSEK